MADEEERAGVAKYTSYSDLDRILKDEDERNQFEKCAAELERYIKRLASESEGKSLAKSIEQHPDPLTATQQFRPIAVMSLWIAGCPEHLIRELEEKWDEHQRKASD
jgi:hypothetical protein